MLPPAIFSRYTQYKDDTALIASWLFQTATKCGYILSKARRREAKAKASQPGGASDHEVKLREFVPMAEAIARAADKMPEVRITTGLIKRFKRCIQARSGTNEWYAVEEDDEEADQSHLHFVGVLQKALQVLVPIHELQELDRTNFKLEKLTATNDNHVLKVKNAFGELKIEEIDEASLDALPSAASEVPRTRAADATFKYTVEDDGTEWYFAVESFFDDMHEMQHFIKGLWTIYAAGAIDVATVSVVSNTAVDLVRRAEKELMDSGPEIPEPWCFPQFEQNLCNLWFNELAFRADIGHPEPSREVFVSLKHWDEVEESFFLAYNMLSTHAMHLSGGSNVPITRPAWLGTYDPLLDRSKASPRTLYEQDAALVSDMLATLVPFATLSNTPNDNELLKRLREETLEGRTPTWLVFAAQLYVDAQDVLRTKSSQPFSGLYDYAREARRVLRGHSKLTDKHELVGYQTEASDFRIDAVQDEIEEWVLEDKMYEIMEREMGLKKQRAGNKKTDSKKTRTWKPYEILKMDPCLAGMWQYSFMLQLQREGLRLVNETQIMVAAHLYNALHQNGYIPKDCVWQDAEHLLEIHARANTFLGQRPKTIEECTRRLALAQGVSPQTFAAGRREGNVVYTKTGGKILAQSTAVASVFYDRFLADGSTELSLSHIETILGFRLDARTKARAKLAKEQGVGSINGAKQSPYTDGDQGAVTQVDAVGDEDYLDENEILDRWQATHALSMNDFLTELAEALHAEHLDLQFDYLSFHRQTRMLLNDIYTACLPFAQNWMKEEMLPALEGSEGPFLTPGLIMVAACDITKAKNLYALKSELVVDTQGLVAAAEVMKEFIEREGATYANKELSMLTLRQKLGDQEHGDEWEDDLADIAADGGLVGAVGRLDGLSISESAQRLKAGTVEDTWRRYKKKEAAKEAARKAAEEPVVRDGIPLD